MGSRALQDKGELGPEIKSEKHCSSRVCGSHRERVLAAKEISAYTTLHVLPSVSVLAVSGGLRR